MSEPAGRLIASIDCTQDYPAEQYFAAGQVRVIEGPAGRYREAEGKPLSRFGYRFAVKGIGRPHVAVIRYPDDRRRFMCIGDGTCYDLTTGVFTGWAQPLSGEMIELRQIFWPRWTDCSVVFMTWSEGEPAAAESIAIYELDDLPALPVTDGGRELGIQYEDPCGTAASEGAMSRDEWIERVIAYARHTGQRLLVYPLAWYHGPLFPSAREPAGASDVVVARDRRQYVRWTKLPADWYARLLERLGEEKLEFRGSLTLLRLGSLMEKMNADLSAIQAGADTINNLLWNDQVQASTRDWTGLYNVRNLDTIAARLQIGDRVEPYAAGIPLAYGEPSGGPYHSGPIFNPLHPVVQEAIVGLAREIAARYGRHAAFKGISFNLFASTMLWFGSIHSGYDDYTVGLFERETGITVPVDAKAPDRFSRRYAYLTFTCRPAWVAWRCAKIRDLFRRIRDAVVGARDDLRVGITVWDEVVIPGVLGEVGAAHQLRARQSNLALYRDGGIDLDLYRDEPGIEVDLALGNSRDRGGHGRHSAAGVNAPIAAQTMYRDHEYLDRATLVAAAAHERPGAFIFNCWVEAWGKHVWFKPDANDPNLREVVAMDGAPADGVLRMNSEYPPDGFWWDSQLRITPGLAAGPHFLEPYAHAVAELDALRITRGGLFLDKAHSEQLRRFAAAFCALPRHKFDTIGATCDPVAVRSLLRGGQQYLYLVNREYYPIAVQVNLTREAEVRDLATGRAFAAPQVWELMLGPYDLRSFSIGAQVTPTAFRATAPEAVVAALTADGRRSIADIAACRAAGDHIPGMDEAHSGIAAAIAQGRLAWLRRALSSYVVRRCREAALARARAPEDEPGGSGA